MPSRQTGIPYKKNINCNRVFQLKNANVQKNKPNQPVIYVLYIDAIVADN